MYLEIGDIKKNTSKKFTKLYTGKKRILKVVPSCYCVDASFSDNRIDITYESTSFNRNILYNYGYQKIYQYVTIYFTDGSSENLELNGRIVV